MFFYVQFLSGSLRGTRRIVSDSDFRHPPEADSPEQVNKTKKYKVCGEDEKTFFSAVILFVSEPISPSKNNKERTPLAALQKPNLPETRKVKISQKAKSTSSGSSTKDKPSTSNQNFPISGSKNVGNVNSENENSFSSTINKTSAAKNNEILSPSEIIEHSIFSQLNREAEKVHSNDDNLNPIDNKLNSLPLNSLSHDSHIVMDKMVPVLSLVEFPLYHESSTNDCSNWECKSRIIKAEDTIANLTRLLNQQLIIVDEQRLEIRAEKERNAELQLKIDTSYDEFQARMLDIRQNSRSASYPPIGFIRSSDDHIHLGRDIWLAKYKYNEACTASSTSLFVKLLSDMVFSPEELQNSTITGKPRNRQKTSKREIKKLDPTRFLVIKDMTRFWLEGFKEVSDTFVDNEVSKVKGHISAKIAELQRTPSSKKKSKESKSKKGKTGDDSSSNDLSESGTLENPVNDSALGNSGDDFIDENSKDNYELNRIFDNLPSSDSD
ncbi:uncharacterized protein LOC127289510 [Leptopilina boulardi]|uniref:uncharacterized protein LOC127289510 n=1 Tax=Leptopilina boulardi TaxID=63433 RepID=UPI0021F62371|nr:uncharacterized protein LOC127289510 [Leptopilina boulardi]